MERFERDRPGRESQSSTLLSDVVAVLK